MLEHIKAITCDTGGTILDWHHGISRALATAGPRRGLQAAHDLSKALAKIRF